MSHFGWPQAILTGMVFMGAGIALSRLGEPKHDNYDLVDAIVAPAIVLALLWWGGFYS